jgi:hypothetical protein
MLPTRMAVRWHPGPNAPGRLHRTMPGVVPYAAMHARAHKGTRGRLVTSRCARPESAIGVAKNRNGETSGCAPGLTRCTKGLDQKPRQISLGPNPEPC